jgi:hypothetical protein
VVFRRGFVEPVDLTHSTDTGSPVIDAHVLRRVLDAAPLAASLHISVHDKPWQPIVARLLAQPELERFRQLALQMSDSTHPDVLAEMLANAGSGDQR